MNKYLMGLTLVLYSVVSAAASDFLDHLVDTSDDPLPYNYSTGDVFSCMSDAVVSISSEGDVVEYKNEGFGFKINSKNTVSFTTNYPLNPFGKVTEFRITKGGDEIKLVVNDFWFAYLTTKTPQSANLVAFDLSLQTVVLNATCERI